MFSLENLLRYSEEHSRSVIVILIGLVIIGSVGGGLWIRSLQVNLSEKDKLVNERLNLIQERYRLEVNEIRSEFRTLQIRFSEMLSVFNEYKDAINSISNKIKETTNKSEIDKLDIEILSSLSENLIQNLHYINRDLEFIEISTSHLIPNFIPHSLFSPLAWDNDSTVPIIGRMIILFIIVASILISIFSIIKYYVRRYRRNKLENYLLDEIKGKIEPSYSRQYELEVESMMNILDYGDRKKVEIVKKLAENFSGGGH